jgi:hypothetical protein
MPAHVTASSVPRCKIDPLTGHIEEFPVRFVMELPVKRVTVVQMMNGCTCFVVEGPLCRGPLFQTMPLLVSA